MFPIAVIVSDAVPGAVIRGVDISSLQKTTTTTKDYLDPHLTKNTKKHVQLPSKTAPDDQWDRSRTKLVYEIRL